MDKGYIRLWRKAIDSGLLKNHKAWIFWTWCLMRANHKKDFKQIVGYREIVLQPGEFVFSRKLAALETGLSEQNIRTCTEFLKKCGNLTSKATSKFSIGSIVNWGTYQYVEDQANQQANQHVTSKQPASNQQVTSKTHSTIIDKNSLTVKYKHTVEFGKIISYLNEKSGKRFKLTSKETQRFITARQNDGYRLDDFKKVIDNKCKEWLSKPDMINFIRPQTLFGTKFEAYLNEIPAKNGGFSPNTGCRRTDNNIKAGMAFLERDGDEQK